MLQFWCLSPVRVAYHGSFRGNLESAFWGVGVSYCSLTSRQRLNQALQKDRGFEMLQFWCLSPVRVAYHGSFRENLESAFWGFGVSYHNLIRQVQVFKTEQLKCCSFDASPQSEWLITAHLEGIWNQHFGALECLGLSSNWTAQCHITTWWNTCKSSKQKLEHSKSCSFECLSPVRVAYYGSFRENLGSAFWGFGLSYHNLIRQMQHFGSLESSKRSIWNVAVLMPLPTQSGLSRLI